jgi:hypothetical protein
MRTARDCEVAVRGCQWRENSHVVWSDRRDFPKMGTGIAPPGQEGWPIS